MPIQGSLYILPSAHSTPPSIASRRLANKGKAEEQASRTPDIAARRPCSEFPAPFLGGLLVKQQYETDNGNQPQKLQQRPHASKGRNSPDWKKAPQNPVANGPAVDSATLKFSPWGNTKPNKQNKTSERNSTKIRVPARSNLTPNCCHVFTFRAV